MRENTRRVAFFDVDETLLADKSMVAFMKYWTTRRGYSDLHFRAIMAELLAHTDRAAANRDYYRRFSGVPITELHAAGQEWYALHRRKPDAFVAPTLRATVEHLAAGHTVVLVSGSCRAVLEPLAADIGADALVCTELVVGSGRILTGDVIRPMIGPAKADAVADVLADLEIDPTDCFAYGDDASDLPMLTAVGHPRVVGDDPVLNDWARRRRWPVLPASTRR